MPLPPPRVPRLLMRVWDAPTRLFHGSIVLLVIASYVTSALDVPGWHMLLGYITFALLLFRLAWGFIGSDTSRFTEFLTNPISPLQQLAASRRQEPAAELGHNAAGGPLVLLMLASLFLQVITGLFSGDGATMSGPLRHLVSKQSGDTLSLIHDVNFYVLLGLTAAHIAAVAAYAALGREELVLLMVTGKKRLPAAMRQPRLGSPALAAVILVGAAIVVWVVARLA